MDSDTEHELKLISLLSQLASLEDPGPEVIIPVITQIISLVSSMDLDSQPKPESELMLLISQSVSLFNSMDLDSQPEPLRKLISFLSQKSDSEQKTVHDSEFMTLVGQTLALKPEPELISLFRQILSLNLFKDSDSDPESELVSLISQLMFLDDSDWRYNSDVISLITQIISLVKKMDLDTQPDHESELLSLTTKTIALFNSMDLDSQPESLSELVSVLMSQDLSSTTNARHLDPDFRTLLRQIMRLEPEPELVSLIYQILYLAISMHFKSRKINFLCPQQEVRFDNGKFHVTEEVSCSSNDKWNCLPFNWDDVGSTEEDTTLIFCRGCNGKNHEEYDKVPVVIQHTLHPKHSLQLVLSQHDGRTRKCYCCDNSLNQLFYYCSVCDSAINLACVEKPPVLSIDLPKCHKHTLTLFPRHTSLTCDVCGFSDSDCPFYICPPCGFVVHQKCANLPRVITISRHPHRIYFTPSFDQGDWACNVCERKIGKDYGHYSCTREDCLFAAHPKCVTHSNVWDGIELEGVPEEIEEEVVEPFVRISDGIIQHFSHQYHHLRLDEYTGIDYDENKMCQACIMPIYFGNFYSCMQCDFILHEVCAELSRKIYHPIHPHLLSLVGGHDGVMNPTKKCSACPRLWAAGFFYQCVEEGCDFQLHVQCATLSEPLLHGSHMHPLFLTSKPGEERRCHVCKESGHCSTDETFNCIKCDFALCFKCATLPPVVRYTDDKHVLTLSYGDNTSTKTPWCDECEKKIDQSVGFYMCDENCCVTLHIECLLGVDLYMMPGSSWFHYFHYGEKVDVLLNNRNTSRPICSNCKKRCPHKIVLQCSGFLFCSTFCIRDTVDIGDKVP